MKEVLKEESNIEKLNKYLVSIGEAPLTEERKIEECDKPLKECDRPVVECDDKKAARMKRFQERMAARKAAKKEPVEECKDPVTESVKKVMRKPTVGRPGSLMESMNAGFAKLYGDFEDAAPASKYEPAKKFLNESVRKRAD